MSYHMTSANFLMIDQLNVYVSHDWWIPVNDW